MPSCIACGTELEPPARAPHTVYVNVLYRIAGQDFCPPTHHQSCGGRRPNHRGSVRLRAGHR